MTVHETFIGNRIFYINRTREGQLNYNSYSDNINKTFHYANTLNYYKALRKAFYKEIEKTPLAFLNIYSLDRKKI